MKRIGNVESYVRDLAPFHTISLEAYMDLKLKPDTANFISIKTGENLVEFITTDITDGELKLEDYNKCNFLRDLDFRTEVTVHFTNLDRLYLANSGNIESVDTIKQTSLEIEMLNAGGFQEILLNVDSIFVFSHTGVPDLTLKGEAQHAFFYQLGSGNYHAEGLIAQEVAINWNSTGYLRVNPVQSLSGEIFSFGDVYYPSSLTNVNVTRFGSGQLIPED